MVIEAAPSSEATVNVTAEFRIMQCRFQNKCKQNGFSKENVTWGPNINVTEYWRARDLLVVKASALCNTWRSKNVSEYEAVDLIPQGKRPPATGVNFFQRSENLNKSEIYWT